MANVRSRQPSLKDLDLGILAAKDAKPGDSPNPALEQMRLSLEDGLLMVFGPEGDPVPPRAFAAAAAADPEARLGLPDGTKVPASRVAAVLDAQVLGRLGRPERGNGWILAMLYEGVGPKEASEEQLRAEQGSRGPRRVALKVDRQVLAGEKLHALVIRDLPADARLSAGVYDAAIGGWVVRPRDLRGLAILPSPDLRGDFTLTLLGIAVGAADDGNAPRVLTRLPVTLA